MEADFKTLLEMGIVMFNVKPDKYGGGRTRDLDESFTAPNWIPIILKKDLHVPVAQFNDMIENTQKHKSGDDTREEPAFSAPSVI
ncbi:MAG: hypothetical protein M1840_009121 [Geoglossum simile]|nr:MAG: hypothetical protein M1840_009121 [Geoglossum simile]